MNFTPIAGGIVLVDIIDELPKHKTKRYRQRTRAIDMHFFHHSGRLGKPGFEGVRNMARYCMQHRGWPGSPYTYWIPWDRLLLAAMNIGEEWPDTCRSNDLVYFRCQPDRLRTYHTGGICNSRGVATALQGNTTTDGLSVWQEEILEAHIPYVAERNRLGLGDISGHWEAKEYGAKKNKPSCPGREAQAWIEAYRDNV